MIKPVKDRTFEYIGLALKRDAKITQEQNDSVKLILISILMAIGVGILIFLRFKRGY